MARAQPVASTITALVTAAAVAVILSTTGQTVVAEQEVLARIDDAGTRSILVGIDPAAEVTPEAVERVGRLSSVEWVVGFGPVQDARNLAVPGGAPVALRPVYGELPAVLVLDPLRQPPWHTVAWAGDEALTTLGFATAAGGVVTDLTGEDYAVVGSLTATDPLDDFNRQIVRLPGPDDDELRRLVVVTHRPDQVDATADLVLDILSPADPAAVTLQTSVQLAAVRAAVAGELGEYSRSLVLTVLAAALGLLLVTSYGTVATRRRDFGRRRALGATRPTIVALVCTQQGLTAGIGILGGTAAGIAFTWRWTHHLPDSRFTAAVAVLVLLVTVAAAVAPAIVAAYRDPVRILRVP
jgi:putative ABC transport system permease protein